MKIGNFFKIGIYNLMGRIFLGNKILLLIDKFVSKKINIFYLNNNLI